MCARALASEQNSVLKKVYALDESILGINSEARKTHTHTNQLDFCHFSFIKVYYLKQIKSKISTNNFMQCC